MSTSTVSMEVANALSIEVSGDALTAELEDGRVISVPLSWYPRLLHATPAERDNWELMAFGGHIHWADLDKRLSVKGLLAGWPSGESETSLLRWLAARNSNKPRAQATSQSPRRLDAAACLSLTAPAPCRLRSR